MMLAFLCIGAVLGVAGMESRWESFETAIGESRKITLEDGSTVQLNTNTHILVRYTGENRTIELTQSAVDRKLTWLHGLIAPEGETLAEAVAEFNRYNREQLAVADPVIADRRIGGTFRATDPVSFILALEAWSGIRAEWPNPLEPPGKHPIRLQSDRPKGK